MDIGFDAKRLFCNFTGLGNYSRTLLKNLSHFYPENNYHLYTPHVRHSSETIPFLEEKYYSVHMPNGTFKGLWRPWKIVGDLQDNGVQIFHGLSHELPFRIPNTGIKTVVTIHDLIFKIYPHTYTAIDRNIYDIKFRYACRNADRIIAISESTRKDIIRYYHIDPGKIDVVYQASNPLYYDESDPLEHELIRQQYKVPGDFILYVGSIEARKNLKTLILALADMPADLRIPLVVVGRGGRYKKECENLVAQKGLSNQVIWIDYLWENKHLQCMYQMATVFVYPSLYEGFGLPVTEALLSKTPVITSGVSSMPEAGGPSTRYVDPKSPKELAVALQDVIGSKTLRETMASEGYLYARKSFASEKVTGEVMQCYLKTFNQ
jgi:glycosyltransferase involved in cell wall biosynthesis